MKKFIILFALLCTLSCKNKENVKTSSQILKINYLAEPASVDPRKANYSHSVNIYLLLYDGLFRINKDGQLTPAIASSVDILNDGKTYIFHLKKTYWTDGSLVTAFDFEYAWKWMLTPTSPAPLANHLYILKNGKAAHLGKKPVESIGVFARDNETLVVDLEHAEPFFLELIALYNFYPVSSKSNQKEYVVNGPFKIQEWTAHQEIVLIKNPNYWDKNHVYLDEVHISFVSDSNTEYKLFEKGELDWAGQPMSLGLPVNALPSIKEIHLLQTNKILSTYYYAFNTKRPLLSHYKIRKALSMAIPRKEIVAHITQTGEIPSFQFVPPEISLLRNTENSWTDSEIYALFQEGLQELNLKKDTLSPLTLCYNIGELHHLIAQTVQDRWKTLFGIEVVLKARDWKAHLNEIEEGDFDVARVMWRGMTSDPLNFLNLFEDFNHPMHGSSWQNKDFEETLARIRNTSSINERLFLIMKAEKILADAEPIAPIFFGTVAYVKNKQLKGYHITRLGNVDFKTAYFE